MDETFPKEWTEFRRRLAQGEILSPKSDLWEGLIRDFPIPSDVPGDDAALFRTQMTRNYNFLLATAETPAIRLKKAWLWTTFIVSVLFTRAARILWDRNLNPRSFEHLMGYPRFPRFMKRLGLWDGYLRFCSSLGIAADSFNTAQMFWISERILAIPSLPKTGLRVLEVGAGTGNLAIMLAKRAGAGPYVIVDLPEMLLYSSRTVRHFLPDVPVRFAPPVDKNGTLTLPSEGFFFVPHQDADRLPADSFDLCININSFQEMLREQVADYLALFQRSARTGGHIVTSNRRKPMKGFDNNPLCYPYRPNEVLLWETDPFMYDVLRWDRPDSTLFRVERVRK